MNHQLSRRSIIAAGMSAMAGLGMMNPMSGVTESAEGRWVSELFGDEVTWDLNHMRFRPDLTRETDNGNVKWADCYLGIGPTDESVALAMVRFQELTYATLEELAEEYPDAYWNEAERERQLIRGTKLTDDAFGFFYIEDPVYRFGGNYFYYAELTPPAEEGGAWSEFLVSGGIKTGVFDLDVLAANGEGVEINGQPTYRAFSFEEVMEAFTAEWEENGLK